MRRPEVVGTFVDIVTHTRRIRQGRVARTCELDQLFISDDDKYVKFYPSDM